MDAIMNFLTELSSYTIVVLSAFIYVEQLQILHFPMGAERFAQSLLKLYFYVEGRKITRKV